ncbi:hypothetical protein IU433_27020 [Nocardia puris]|uniref:Uncharacterized protein n=1 Tax=Nocardia puris TaxID=208602 RepID=A0A366DJN8_9NOCA|nr:hypothetical protein [Nocardia puris]MBF6213045.1 hypothetical protein [Nocardia puris]MBF6368036.1 hypothetical protein [Nocardia puris]MBF6462669.1 hypothetical protein [Nocardia puris]RBO90292.1 hypothetical protein DFR74_106177 [Nocardia puris]
MTDTAEQLEVRIAELRTGVRRAVAAGDRATARQLRAELRRTEDAWDAAVLGTTQDQTAPGAEPDMAAPSTSRIAAPAEASAMPIREHVHRALTLIGAPASPKLVLAVHESFFSGALVPARLTSLRRDEERSFRASPFTRPYYICAALTADHLAPARGLMAVSTWPLAQRMIGPLSPRVDLLTATIRLAGHLADRPDSGPGARRVLWKLAVSVPGVQGSPDTIDPVAVIDAAAGELAVHREEDARRRAEAARRADHQLDDAARYFGIRLGVARGRNEVG